MQKFHWNSFYIIIVNAAHAYAHASVYSVHIVSCICMQKSI